DVEQAGRIRGWRRLGWRNSAADICNAGNASRRVRLCDPQAGRPCGIPVAGLGKRVRGASPYRGVSAEECGPLGRGSEELENGRERKGHQCSVLGRASGELESCREPKRYQRSVLGRAGEELEDRRRTSGEKCGLLGGGSKTRKARRAPPYG